MDALALLTLLPWSFGKGFFYYSDTDMVTYVNMYSEPANDSSISDLVPDSRQELQSCPRRFWPFWRLIWLRELMWPTRRQWQNKDRENQNNNDNLVTFVIRWVCDTGHFWRSRQFEKLTSKQWWQSESGTGQCLRLRQYSISGNYS